MTYVEVRLTAVQAREAWYVGGLRQRQAVGQGRTDQHGLDPVMGLEVHAQGAAGEMAVALALGVHWAAPVNTYRRGGDVGVWQVRTRSEHWYDLLLRPNDRPNDVYLLATGKLPTFRVHGWITARDGMLPRLRAEHGGRVAAYFVPKDLLHPLGTLPLR